jgi:pimeloyl-ACP methyl ester carboxylesterase
VELTYVRVGAGEPLLLVHPLGGTHDIWRPVIPMLAAHRDVIAVDMPGFGGSPPLPAPQRPTPTALAGALIELCSRLGVDRPHVAGNSLGGWVALEIAKAGAARSVTAISPAGLWRNPLRPRPRDSHTLGQRLRPLIHRVIRTRRGRRLVLGSAFARPDLISATDARLIVDGYLDSPAYADANREMRAAVFEHEDRIDVPVTLVWGELDRVVGRPSRTRRPPGSRYVEVPGWGHVPMWDDPDGVSKLLLSASAGAGGRRRELAG